MGLVEVFEHFWEDDSNAVPANQKEDTKIIR